MADITTHTGAAQQIVRTGFEQMYWTLAQMVTTRLLAVHRSNAET